MSALFLGNESQAPTGSVKYKHGGSKIEYPEFFGDLVGSGTTILLTDKLSQPCYAAEMSPAIAAVCLERLAGVGKRPRVRECVSWYPAAVVGRGR